jgi:hypothetical protein
MNDISQLEGALYKNLVLFPGAEQQDFVFLYIFAAVL